MLTLVGRSVCRYPRATALRIAQRALAAALGSLLVLQNTGVALAGSTAPVNGEAKLACGLATVDLTQLELVLEQSNASLMITETSNYVCSPPQTVPNPSNCSLFSEPPATGGVLAPSQSLGLSWTNPQWQYQQNTYGPKYHFGYDGEFSTSTPTATSSAGAPTAGPTPTIGALHHKVKGVYSYSSPGLPDPTMLCTAFPLQGVIGMKKKLSTAVSTANRRSQRPAQSPNDDCLVQIGVVLGESDIEELQADWQTSIHLSVGAAPERMPLASLHPRDNAFLTARPLASGIVPVVDTSGRLVTEPQLCVSSESLMRSGLIDERGDPKGWGFVVVADWFRKGEWTGPSASVYYGLDWGLVGVVPSRHGQSAIYLPVMNWSETLTPLAQGLSHSKG